MKKKVNGKVVEIGNLELYMLADQGSLLNKKVSSLVCDTIETKSELVRDIVREYNSLVDKLVYPLSSIESELKYITLGELLRHKLQGKYGVIEMDVRDYIAIEVEPDTVLKLLGRTWAIEATTDSYRKRERVSVDDYREEEGYLEFKWVRDKVMQGESTESYYREFMGDFLKACRGEDFILKWELEHILDFGYLPSEMKTGDRSIVDYENRVSYNLDVYTVGVRKTNDTVMRLTVGSNGRADTSMEKKEIKVYNFEVYWKSLDGINNRMDKVKGGGTSGFANIFEQLLNEGVENGNVATLGYRGFIIEDKIVFEVNHDIFICSLTDCQGATRLLSNVQLHSYQGSIVYFKKRERKASKVWRETIYSYDLSNKKARLCKIQHTTV